MIKPEKILIILNPAARSERAGGLLGGISALPGRPSIRLTSRPGDAEAIAERATKQGFHAVVAAGGDGTVNEVVNGLAGSDIPFGILPVGTMNVFAAELGIPLWDLEAAWRVVRDGHTRAVDLPLANGEAFVQLAGAGLDAEVVRQTSRESKNALGPISYLLTLAQVAARKPPLISIQPEGSAARTGSFVLAGNGRFYGGPFVLFRDARPDDGLLDILIFKNQSQWDVIRYMQAIAFGAHPELPDVEYLQAPSMRLECENYVPVEVDGELVGALPYDFRISPTKLRVLAPAD